MPSQSSSPSPAAMTERLIDAALTHESAGHAAEAEARKALFAARGAVEAALAQRDDLLAACAPIMAMVRSLGDTYGFPDDKAVDTRHHGLPYNDFTPLTYGDLRKITAIARATEA